MGMKKDGDKLDTQSWKNSYLSPHLVILWYWVPNTTNKVHTVSAPPYANIHEVSTSKCLIRRMEMNPFGTEIWLIEFLASRALWTNCGNRGVWWWEGGRVMNQLRDDSAWRIQTQRWWMSVDWGQCTHPFKQRERGGACLFRCGLIDW